MNKKEYCKKHNSVAYYSGFNGLEIKGVEHGLDDHLYCVSNVCGGEKAQKYHRCKIYYEGKDAFFRVSGYKISFNECIKL